MLQKADDGVGPRFAYRPVMTLDSSDDDLGLGVCF